MDITYSSFKEIVSIIILTLLIMSTIGIMLAIRKETRIIESLKKEKCLTFNETKENQSRIQFSENKLKMMKTFLICNILFILMETITIHGLY